MCFSTLLRYTTYGGFGKQLIVKFFLPDLNLGPERFSVGLKLDF